MAMFPQFFTHPSLYPNFFRATSAANSPPNLSLSSQLALLSNSGALPPNSFASSAAGLLTNSHNSHFLVDNLLRDRAAAAAAAAVAAAAAANSADNFLASGHQNNLTNTSEHDACNFNKHLNQELCKQSDRSSEATDHETESSHCDRNSDSSSPIAKPTSQLKFGVSAILSDAKESKLFVTKSNDAKGMYTIRYRP